MMSTQMQNLKYRIRGAILNPISYALLTLTLQVFLIVSIINNSILHYTLYTVRGSKSMYLLGSARHNPHMANTRLVPNSYEVQSLAWENELVQISNLNCKAGIGE